MITDYLAHMRRRRLSDGTIYRRRCELALWLEHVRTVQQALGHVSLNSTQLYTHVDAGTVVAAAQLLT